MSAEPQRAEGAPKQDGTVAPFPGAKDGSAAENRGVRRPRKRIALILAVPLALALVGGYFWLTGGRYVSTDNAYVQQDKVTIVPEVSGRIVKVGATENQNVAKGALLLLIDDSEYVVAEQQAEAAVASARLNVEKLKAAYQAAISDKEAAGQALSYAQDTYNRQDALAKRGVVAKSALDKARLDLQQAQASARAAEQAVIGAQAALAGDPSIPTDKHPAVLEALAKLAQAKLDLAHTKVTAPAAGIVSQTDRLQVGEYVAAGSSVASLVETGKTWIEANFKETELEHLKEGQPVSIAIDTYPGQELKGRVESLSAATGAEFSLLPAQNATGNWVKVVQRVPVRIALPAGVDVPLRMGMSANVSVDTGRLSLLGLAFNSLSSDVTARAAPAGPAATGSVNAQ